METVDAEVKDLAAKQLSRGTESSKDCGHSEAKTYQHAADRNATRDAKATSAQARENACGSRINRRQQQ